MRIFGAERITGLMERLGMEEDVPIEHRMVNAPIENAQKKVEGHNFDIRKNLLEYDDVMNQQRKTIYALRRQILEGRYAPEPTEEEKKAGKTAADAPVPTESGNAHRRDARRACVRPTLARMVDALTQAPPPSATPDAAPPSRRRRCRSIRRVAALARSTASSAPTSTRAASPRIAPATLDRLADEVASSLIQQRERLLDLVRGDARRRSRRALPAETRTPRSGTSTRSRDRGQGALQLRAVSIDDQGRSSARRWPRRCGPRSRR